MNNKLGRFIFIIPLFLSLWLLWDFQFLLYYHKLGVVEQYLRSIGVKLLSLNIDNVNGKDAQFWYSVIGLIWFRIKIFYLVSYLISTILSIRIMPMKIYKNILVIIILNILIIVLATINGRGSFFM